MTSSYESYFRARADEPSVGIPHSLKHMLRISPQARDVNREQSLFWANHEQTGSYSESEGSLGHSGLLSPGFRITGKVNLVRELFRFAHVTRPVANWLIAIAC